MSDSVQPHRRQPTRLPHLQSRTLEWVAISFSNVWKWKVKVKSLSRVWPLVTPWTAAYKAPPSMGFSRQEYWSGLPLPSPPLCLIIPFPVLYLMLQSLPTCWFPPAPRDIPAVMLPLSPNSWLLLICRGSPGPEPWENSPHTLVPTLCVPSWLCAHPWVLQVSAQISYHCPHYIVRWLSDDPSTHHGRFRSPSGAAAESEGFWHVADVQWRYTEWRKDMTETFFTFGLLLVKWVFMHKTPGNFCLCIDMYVHISWIIYFLVVCSAHWLPQTMGQTFF